MANALVKGVVASAVRACPWLLGVLFNLGLGRWDNGAVFVDALAFVIECGVTFVTCPFGISGLGIGDGRWCCVWAWSARRFVVKGGFGRGWLVRSWELLSGELLGDVDCFSKDCWTDGFAFVVLAVVLEILVGMLAFVACPGELMWRCI